MASVQVQVTRFLRLMGIVALFSAASATGDVLQVKYIGNNHQVSEQYYLALIAAALETTRASHGPYHINFSEQTLTSERKHELLIAGDAVNIDRLVGFPVAQGPRLKLLRVDHPILQGAMGYRVLVIHKNKQARFNKIHSLNELRQLRMGFGRGWEGHVYTHNGLNVTESLNMASLLKMLAAQRYAFVPLSIIEVEDNYLLDGRRANNLVIENNLLLYMPLPVYFYVSPSAPELAERLQIGLQILTESGAIDDLFQHYFGARLARLNLSKRRLIPLENPDKSDNHPEADHEWLNNF
jgi:hypothetical protein